MKLRFVPICQSMLVGRLGLLTEGVKRPETICSSGLPVDAKIVGADFNGQQVRIWVEHESFTEEDPAQLDVHMTLMQRKQKKR